jgi:hypothetical protein
MTSLALPGCFEADWGIASRFGGWAVLGALGHTLLGGRFTDDDLWPVLAALGARDPRQPRPKLRSQLVFRLPPSWYDAVRPADEGFVWAAREGRLRLWSTLGFLLAEIDRDERPAGRQAAVELARWSAAPAESLVAGRFDHAPIERGRLVPPAGICGPPAAWRERALPYLRHRLRRALAGDGGAAHDLAGEMLLVLGRLYVTATHVDLVAPLDAISVPVRRAGLDRDPGWVADLGRVILFHFR